MFHAFFHDRRFAREDRSGRRHGPQDQHGPHHADHHTGPHHGPRGHRRGSLGRFFAHGDLRLLILQLIAEKPRHGYEIIKEIEDRVGGAYSPSPGVIYPTLTLLEELGHVAAAPGEGARKSFAITPEGRAYLEANRTALDAILARLQAATQDGNPAPEVLRAMQNLRLALRMRLVRGPLTTPQAQAIAAALDAAATQVERA